MSADRWRRVSEIYSEAIERPVEERQEYLRQACAGDDSLRGDVESLLAADRKPVIVDTPAFEVAAGVLADEAQSSLIGQCLGVYQITAFLGAGGMGDVYRARDSKLGREVAIKVLPDSFAQDPGWRTRFHREGTLLATLNHPNIGAIYGIEECEGVTALVLELVEGPTLADRIAQGPIPLDDALPIAMQIAEAIEAAHERGIIHRDLKPANIKLRPDGVVKVLDFGLAKAIEPTGESPATRSPSPKITMTQTGVILGTATYMSPEQVRGRTVDKRSDVWAFGCVLFEMLTGTRAFGGDDVADTFAVVVGKEPDWSALPANTPAAIRRLLQRALTKELRNRLADASTARLEIAEGLAMPEGKATGAAPAPAEGPRWRLRVAWVLIATLAVAVAALSVPAARHLRDTAPAQSVQFLIDAPLRPSSTQVSISPDGRTVAYVAEPEGAQRMLHVRPIDSVNAQPIAGTEGAAYPFWSPDSRSIGFQIGLQTFAQPKPTLKRVEVTGGPPQNIARCQSGTWNSDGVILCMEGGGLSRVSASGGPLTRVTASDGSLQETAHVWPQFLPDGRHFLYLAWSTKPEYRTIYVGALDSNRKTRIMSAESKAVYVPPGFLLFQRQGTLFAQASIWRLWHFAANPFESRKRSFTHLRPAMGHSQCPPPGRWCIGVMRPRRFSNSRGSIARVDCSRRSDSLVGSVGWRYRQTRRESLCKGGSLAHQAQASGPSTSRPASALC